MVEFGAEARGRVQQHLRRPVQHDRQQATALLQSNHLPADGDPMFVDPAAYDDRLKAGSPAIDKAVAPGSAFGFDWRRSSSTCTRFSTSPARPRVLAPQAVPTATSWANRSSRSADLTGGAGA